MDNAKSVKRETEVRVQMNASSQLVEDLNNVVNRLNTRLKPLLKEVEKIAEDPNFKEEGLVPLAADIRTNNNMIRRVISILTEIDLTLEL